jgi:hypothetical protein
MAAATLGESMLVSMVALVKGVVAVSNNVEKPKNLEISSSGRVQKNRLKLLGRQSKKTK